MDDRHDSAAARVARVVGFGAVPEGAAGTERARLAAAVRRLMAATVTAPADEAALAAAADEAERLAALVEEGATGSRFDAVGPAPDGTQPFPMGTHPIVGDGNPVAPPLVIDSADGGVVRARARYSAAHEGLPGRVHGGYLAATFDTMLGFAAALGGSAGVTGTLSLRFVRPTPLGEELVYEAWPDGVDGRKATVRGRLLAGGEVTVEAEGVFVTVATTKLTDRPDP